MWPLFLILILIVLDATSLQAQRPLEPGARVRITAPDHRPVTVGNLVRITGDTAAIVDANGTLTTVVLGPSRRLELSLGRRRQVGRGAGTGFLLGAVAGAALGAASWKPCEPNAFLCLQPENRGQAAVLGGVLLGVPGLVVGALAGSARRERWERVRRQADVSVHVAPSQARIGVQLAL